ncbi:MAG: hypothetical protein IKG93_06740 [Clostridiales bacterium]|nr:hypothetical protein [Clostridiales bacterium]
MKRTSLIPILLAGALLLSSCTTVSSKRTSSSSSDSVPATSSDPSVSGTTETSETEDDSKSTSAASSIGVKVNWDNYEPSSADADIFTRLPGTPMTDFVPSDNYGEIYPYYTQHMQVLSGIDSGYGGSNPVGFFSEKGVLICDPIFDDYFMLPGGDYLVIKYNDSDSEESGSSAEWGSSEYNRSEYTNKYGILSHDGASYTGLIYDGCCYLAMDPKDENIYLFTLKEKGVEILVYRCTTREIVTTFDMDYIPSPWGYYKIVSDDIFFSYSYDGYMDPVRFRKLDGTVPELDFLTSGYSFRGRPFGDAMLFRDERSDYENDIWRIYSFKGNKLLDTEYSDFIPYTPDKMLMVREDGYDLIDGNGRVAATLDNTEHKWTDVSGYEGYLVGKKDGNAIVMNEDFKTIKTFENSDTPRFILQKGMNTDPRSERYYPGEPGIVVGVPQSGLDPIIYCSSQGQGLLYNIKTKADYQVSDTYNLIYQDESGFIVCRQDNWDDEGNPIDGLYLVLDAKDMHVIYESNGLINILTDPVTGKAYLLHQDTNPIHHTRLIDAEEGTVLWEKENPDHVTIVPMKIVNGCLSYMVYSPEYEFASEPDMDGWYDSYLVRELTSTCLAGPDGQVLFKYRALIREDDV